MLVNIQSSNLLSKSIGPTDQVTYNSGFSHSKHAFKMCNGIFYYRLKHNNT
jgi:hypothetical protein